MSIELFMGVDIGTTGVRGILFDRQGNQVSSAYKEYPMICLEPGMSELEPDTVFNSLIEVVKGCVRQTSVPGGKVEAIGFSTQMHSFLAVDADGKCLTNVLTWADSRPLRQADAIRDGYDCGELYRSTGCRIQHPMYPLSKILWLKNEKPDIFRKAAKFLSVKEYVLHKLYGRYVIDITDASASGCFNIHKFDWDEQVLGILGIDAGRLGEPVECTCILRNMKKEYAAEMGLDPDVPVVVGSGDGIVANVGCGVVDDTSMSCTIGTSGALRIAVDKPLIDPLQRTWCYCFTRDTWVAGGAINNGGIVLRWLRDEYRKQYEYEAESSGAKSVYELFDRYAAEVRPGSDGLIFLPFLTGERSPNWNASARGTLHGLQLMHGKKHLIKAAMEGVIYRMFSVYEVITQLNDNVKTIMANGGYVKSDIWLQIQADVFNKEIAVAGIGEAAAFGAAFVAMAAVGAVSSLKQTLPCMKPGKVIKPIDGNHQVYSEMYWQFKELYGRIYEQKQGSGEV